MAAGDDLEERLCNLLDTKDVGPSLSAAPDLSGVFAAKERLENLFGILRHPKSASESESALHLQPGDRLGEFLLLKSLASGGMGHVFLARQESLGRVVALKVCKPDVSQDARLRSRFMAEGRALARATAS